MPRNLLALLIGAFLDVSVIYAAAAADVPIRTPVYAPPVTLPLYNWSGLYLGANGGGGRANPPPECGGPGGGGSLQPGLLRRCPRRFNHPPGPFLVCRAGGVVCGTM